MARRPVGRRRRRRTIVGLVVATFVWFITAVVPLWSWADAHSVPSGATTSQATVVGYPRSGLSARRGNGVRGKIARVELADGSEDTIYLPYRLFYPDEGDRLTVYTEDGELRSTAEGSTFDLVSGGALLVFWPAMTIWYLRRGRRVMSTTT